jgi:hypothetical protein
MPVSNGPSIGGLVNRPFQERNAKLGRASRQHLGRQLHAQPAERGQEQPDRGPPEDDGREQPDRGEGQDRGEHAEPGDQ